MCWQTLSISRSTSSFQKRSTVQPRLAGRHFARDQARPCLPRRVGSIDFDDEPRCRTREIDDVVPNQEPGAEIRDPSAGAREARSSDFHSASVVAGRIDFRVLAFGEAEQRHPALVSARLRIKHGSVGGYRPPERFAPLCPAVHLPRKGGDRQLQASPLFLQRRRLAKPSGRPISPLAGEMSGRTEGGAVPETLPRSTVPSPLDLPGDDALAVAGSLPSFSSMPSANNSSRIRISLAQF